MQIIAKSIFIDRRVKLFPFLHTDCTAAGQVGKTMMLNQIIGLTRNRDGRIFQRGKKIHTLRQAQGRLSRKGREKWGTAVEIID